MKTDMNANYKDIDGTNFNIEHNREAETVQIYSQRDYLTLDLHALKDLCRDLNHIVELMEDYNG